jgi:hypothetical protein
MAREKIKKLDLLEPTLIETFDLERVYINTPLMNDWLSAKSELNNFDMTLLKESQLNLLENVDSWNEEELKMNFISFVIYLAHYDKPIRAYYDREISVKIGEHTLLCKADMLLSSGIREKIKTPYFFLHEYKREQKYSGDPIGQMLGGMLIGQAKNNNGKPMYGCYVQGRFWFFSILDDKQYVISQSFDAASLEGAKQIIMILRKMKELIHTTLM